jgi:D-lactate dehydrogenase (cytochrome)
MTEPTAPDPATALCDRFGDLVAADPETRRYYSNDVFWQPGILPAAVAFPQTAEQAAEIIGAATALGLAIVPRGGGMSYTKGYLPDRAGAVVVDARKLNRIVEVNTDDLYITVEAGCTWAQVNDALDGTGLRSGYWGPLSGVNATVGGALSQNSAFFGSALNATVAEAVLGVTVVTADGELLTTGSGGRSNARPFTREGGPDLTGLFVGDNGALGFKLSATLRLLPRPTSVGYLSFGFASLHDMAGVQVALGRERLIAEGFGIDRTKAQHSASVNRISDGLKTLGNVARAGKSMLGGIKDAVGVAAGGAAFLQKHAYSLHLVIEARNDAELATSMTRARVLCAAKGTELPDTVPRVMRSKPFSPVRGMLGRDGERWVPIHAIFPMGSWASVVEANEAFFERQRGVMEQHGIVYSVMTMTVGAEFFIEPAFYWPDALTDLHVQSVGADVTAPWRDRPENPAVRDAVARLRAQTQDLYISLGGVNWQVARDYPFRSVLSPATLALLEALKNHLDPRGLMNPGSLGLASSGAAPTR